METQDGLITRIGRKKANRRVGCHVIQKAHEVRGAVFLVGWSVQPRYTKTIPVCTIDGKRVRRLNEFVHSSQAGEIGKLCLGLKRSLSSSRLQGLSIGTQHGSHKGTPGTNGKATHQQPQPQPQPQPQQRQP